jgi:transcription initiation factor IIE alpha subunit
MNVLPNTVYRCKKGHVTMGCALRNTYNGYECPQCGQEVVEDDGTETGKWLLKFYDIPRDPCRA